MKSGFLVIWLVILLAFSGCVKQDVSNEVSPLPEIRAVLDEYPDAYIVTLFMRKDVISLIIGDIREACPGLELASYWYVTLNADQRTWEFYVDEQVSRVVCAIYPESQPLEECGNDSECDDFDAGTKNECMGSPMKCVYTRIVECVNGDGFCPTGCDYANDSDCPAVDTCQGDADCNDSNSLTADACIGTPKHCMNSLKSCAEVRGYECEPYEECLGGTLPVSGGGLCCDRACTKTKSCTGIECASTEKCVNGLCVKKTCAEMKLGLCTSSEVCTSSTYVDDLGIKCCTGECRQPCTSDANCDVGEVCKEGEKYCIAISCSGIGGKTCNGEGELCTGETEATLDNDECCLECLLKTCDQRNGIVCDASKGLVCPDSTVETFGGEECCLSECVHEPCFDMPCAINKKCVEGVCELKTCKEMGGIDWPDQESCAGNFYRTEGILDCCIQKTCDEFGGSECLAGEACSGTIRKSTDVESCCVGSCLAAP